MPEGDDPAAMLNPLLQALPGFAAFDDPRCISHQDTPPLTEVSPTRARQLAGIGADIEDREPHELEDALDTLLMAAALGDVRFYETRHQLVYEHVVFQGGLLMVGDSRAAILWYINNQ
mgnify:CR=1 FL=1